MNEKFTPMNPSISYIKEIIRKRVENIYKLPVSERPAWIQRTIDFLVDMFPKHSLAIPEWVAEAALEIFNKSSESLNNKQTWEELGVEK